MSATVGVVTALAREARLVRRAARAAGVEAALRIGCCGMGPERARAEAEALAGRGASLLLCTGYAGALDARLAPGDLVLATEVRGASGDARLACDSHAAALAARALADHPALHRGPLLSVDRVVDGPGARRELARRSGALAVDMESMAVVETAMREGLPWLVLRAVSDGLAQRLPPRLDRLLDERGRPRPAGVLRALLGNPLGLRHLPALAIGARRADRSLHSALLRLLPALAGGVA